MKDIHKEYERLKNLGVVFRKEPAKSETGIETVFEDTCGNLIQIYQLA
ncbi:VOC family protein [Leptospira alstonii]|uniref:Glyoxalase family protein n=2 Tax=Leptospira alstonii TaxID=28452 RepID=M6CJM4_9LEPT|nr:VOC family protein [Leptospira alstonii]EMJ91929.1 glyoxalase family protein [Leptospira alstonii serovar Sichuan str. 79601]EQA81339.1 glyoxalase family protein [Leptospira alstonii serovar Pingchang str. 80-412]